MKQILPSVGLVALLLAAAWSYWFVDWCSYFDAVPPKTTEVINDRDASLVVFEMNGQDALATTASLGGGSSVKVQGTLTLNMSQWRWISLQDSLKMNPEAMRKKAERDQSLPLPVVVVDLLRKSSIGTGEVSASRRTLIVKRQNETQGKYSGELRIPPVPGVYRVRMTLGERFVGQKDVDPIHKRTIKCFNIQVVALQ